MNSADHVDGLPPPSETVDTIPFEELMRDNFPGSSRGRKKGWQQGGQLVTGGNNPFGMQCNLADETDQYGLYTAQFTVFPPAGGVNFEATADIEWSLEGGTIYRRASIVNGMAITGNAHHVRIIISDSTNPGTPGVPYSVFVTVSPGTRPATANGPILMATDTNNVKGVVTVAGAGGTRTFNIPSQFGARSVEVLAYAAGHPNPQLEVQQIGNASIWKEYNAPEQPGFIMISPNATQIELINPNAFAVDTTLTWGIDG